MQHDYTKSSLKTQVKNDLEKYDEFGSIPDAFRTCAKSQRSDEAIAYYYDGRTKCGWPRVGRAKIPRCVLHEVYLKYRTEGGAIANASAFFRKQSSARNTFEELLDKYPLIQS